MVILLGVKKRTSPKFKTYGKIHHTLTDIRTHTQNKAKQNGEQLMTFYILNPNEGLTCFQVFGGGTLKKIFKSLRD